MKILIVDDDVNVVKMIQKMIDWAKLGIDEVLLAYNGEQSKKIILENSPEILLCDIEMPICNGLELLQWMNDNDLHSYLIYLTCHEEFRLVQQALRMGASDYIVKPLPEKELEMALSKAISVIHFNEERRGREVPSSHSSSNKAPIYHEFVAGLLDTTMLPSRAAVAEEAERRGIDFDVSKKYRILCIGFRLEQLVNARLEYDVLRFVYMNLCQDMFGRDPEYPFVSSVENEESVSFYLILEEDEAKREFLIGTYAEFRQYIEKVCSLTPYALAGEPVYCDELSNERKKIMKNMSGASLRDDRILFVGESNKDSYSTDKLNLSFLSDCLYQKNKIGYMRTIREYLKAIRDEDLLNSKQLYITMNQLKQVFFTYLHSFDVPQEEIYQHEELESLEARAANSDYEVISYCSYMYDLCMNLTDVKRGEGSIVQKIIQYIDTHYKEEFTREELAEIVFITPNYLSQRFGDEMHMSIREYVNQKRIREAMKLLKSSDVSIGWVAMEVGFSSAPYFTRVFKQVTGESPIKWREKK